MKLLLVCLALVGLSLAKSSNKTRASTLGLSCNCGWRNSGRIVGGKETKANEYPWMASLSNGCGGSIITPWHVLTAAHCTYGQRPSDIQVSVGRHLQIGDKGKDLNFHRIARIFQHESYDPQRTLNDISVLYLANEIKFNQNVGPICMPSQKVNLVGSYIKIIGWGKTMGTGDENVLREVDVKVVGPDYCQKYWKNFSPSGVQLCAYENRKDSCNGDSGGPLVYLDPETNKFTQAALVSYGDPNCGRSPFPSVNTDVFAYLPWIQKAISASRQDTQVCQKFRLGRSAILLKN